MLRESAARHYNHCGAGGRLRDVITDTARGERAEEDRQMLDGLDCGVRIVDGRREGLTRDIDELSESKPGVLLQGSLEPDPDRPV
jgi:hypothetical protein